MKLSIRNKLFCHYFSSAYVDRMLSLSLPLSFFLSLFQTEAVGSIRERKKRKILFVLSRQPQPISAKVALPPRPRLVKEGCLCEQLREALARLLAYLLGLTDHLAVETTNMVYGQTLGYADNLLNCVTAGGNATIYPDCTDSVPACLPA
jgi:hypothetical protein